MSRTRHAQLFHYNINFEFQAWENKCNATELLSKRKTATPQVILCMCLSLEEDDIEQTRDGPVFGYVAFANVYTANKSQMSSGTVKE